MTKNTPFLALHSEKSFLLVRCLQGSDAFEICDQSNETVRLGCEKWAKKREKLTFTEVDCEPEYKQCFDVQTECSGYGATLCKRF